MIELIANAGFENREGIRAQASSQRVGAESAERESECGRACTGGKVEFRI